MATNYPTSKQEFTNPEAGSYLTSPSHAGLHTYENDTVEAIQDQIGYTDAFKFALLEGQAGGQTLIGGTASGEDLTLQSTSHATKGAIVWEDSVYNDANVGGLALRAGVTTPPVTQWVDNLGANTGIYGLGFAANDEANGTIEIPHDYKEGTDIVFHIHWGANDAPTGTDYVKWQLSYFIDLESSGSTTPPATVIVVETAYDTRYQHKRSDFPTITGTNFKIGDQVNFNLKRITAAGDAYAGVAIAETIGFHYECDTLGSKQITSK